MSSFINYYKSKINLIFYLKSIFDSFVANGPGVAVPIPVEDYNSFGEAINDFKVSISGNPDFVKELNGINDLLDVAETLFDSAKFYPTKKLYGVYHNDVPLL